MSNASRWRETFCSGMAAVKIILSRSSVEVSSLNVAYFIRSALRASTSIVAIASQPERLNRGEAARITPFSAMMAFPAS